MTCEEVHALAALARRLETTPRHVLVHAARMAERDEVDANKALHQLKQSGMHHSTRAADCGNLLLTSVASYARTSLSFALDSTWQGLHQAHG